MLELRGLLRALDPARVRKIPIDTLNAKWSAFQARLALYLEDAQELAPVALLTEVMQAIAALMQRLQDEASARVREQWSALREQLQPLYSDLARWCAAHDIHVPALRPTNAARSVLHVCTAACSIAIVLLVPSTFAIAVIATLGLVVAWGLEITRRRSPEWNATLMRSLGAVAHPHEAHCVNSSTWYTTALFLLAITGSKPLCVAAVAVMGLGDPMAAVIGRRWGRTKLSHGRSLEGSLAFVVVGFLAAFAALSLGFPGLGLAAAAAVAGFSGLGGAVAEVACGRIDDNFAVPVAAGLCAGVGLALFGLF